MALIPVVLKTAHYLADVWHAAGSVVHIAEEHFNPALHDKPPVVQAAEPKSDGATSIALESIPDLIGGLHRRIDALEAAVHARLLTLEEMSVSVVDFAQLHHQVQELAKPAAPPSPQPPVENTDPTKEG